MRNRKLPFTCKDCPDRYPGCHDHCNKYKREKAIWDKQKAEEAMDRELSGYVAGSISGRSNTNAKRRRDNRGRKYFYK